MKQNERQTKKIYKGMIDKRTMEEKLEQGKINVPFCPERDSTEQYGPPPTLFFP